MRDTVCIVLNEREPEKAALAEKLQKTLAQRDITATRLEPSAEIENVLFSSPPRVLILDYLLGDYSTGLDVLTRLQTLDRTRRPITFFLTDEPEVQVAVDAMKLGARDYFPTGNPKAVEALAGAVATLLRDEKLKSATAPAVKTLSLSDMVFQDEASRKLLKQLNVCVAKKCPLLILLGPPGSGRTTLAEALLQEFGSPTCKTIDLGYFAGDLKEKLLLGRGQAAHGLGYDLSAVVERLEEDDGALLEALARSFPHLWSNEGRSGSFLILTTSDRSAAVGWKRTFPEAQILELPELKERPDDLTPLAQNFALEAARLSGLRLKPLEAGEIRFLQEQEWPGEVRQLRATVIDGLIASSLSAETFTLCATQRLAAWEEETKLSAPGAEISPLSAALALERFSHSYRAAAACLGISTARLAALLRAGGADYEKETAR